MIRPEAKRSTLELLSDRAGRGKENLFDFQVSAPIKGLQRRLREACDRAGVARFTPHGLRRMVVGRLLRARVDPGTAAALTGHSVQVMLRFYQEVTDEDRREAAERANLGELGPTDTTARAMPSPAPQPSITSPLGSMRPPVRKAKRVLLSFVASVRQQADPAAPLRPPLRALSPPDTLRLPTHRRPP